MHARYGLPGQQEIKNYFITHMKKNPLVSVIIPVFNGASYLVEAVESVQKSTFKDFEIMLIDDGSTDNSKRVCRLLEKA